MLPSDIKEILRKYYDGESSIEEEKLLKDFFSKKSCDASEIPDQNLFQYINFDSNDLINNDLIWESVVKDENKHLKQRKIIKLVTSIAASSIIVFSFSFWYLYSPQNSKHFMVDTYTNPKDAYIVARKYIGLISNNLSIAYDEIQPIKKLALPWDAFQSLTAINDGFEHLCQLKKFDASTSKIKKFTVLDDYILLNEKYLKK